MVAGGRPPKIQRNHRDDGTAQLQNMQWIGLLFMRYLLLVSIEAQSSK